MDQGQFGVDGMPLHPRPGHHDPVTGVSFDRVSYDQTSFSWSFKVFLFLVIAAGGIGLLLLAGRL